MQSSILLPKMRRSLRVGPLEYHSCDSSHQTKLSGNKCAYKMEIREGLAFHCAGLRVSIENSRCTESKRACRFFLSLSPLALITFALTISATVLDCLAHIHSALPAFGLRTAYTIIARLQEPSPPSALASAMATAAMSARAKSALTPNFITLRHLSSHEACIPCQC